MTKHELARAMTDGTARLGTVIYNEVTGKLVITLFVKVKDREQLTYATVDKRDLGDLLADIDGK